MNPRDFCRMPGYKLALALTFNFDPLFFERVILHDLWQGGTSETIVLADARQLLETVPQYVGQLRHLGRSYCLAGAGPATCHPKIILRVGAQGAAVWIGSANLTQGGWGGNRELAKDTSLSQAHAYVAPTSGACWFYGLPMWVSPKQIRGRPM